MSLAWSLAAVPLLIGLNAFFVISEYAVVATRPAQIQMLAHARTNPRRRCDGTPQGRSNQRDRRHPGLHHDDQPDARLDRRTGDVGGAAQRVRTAHHAVAPIMSGVATALSFIVVTLLTVVFSELLPKALTLRYVEPAPR
jgi:CBS domain containing-hemolysin-like protein